MKDYNEHMLNGKSDTAYELHDQDLMHVSAGVCLSCQQWSKMAKDSAEALKYQEKPASMAKYLEHSNKVDDLQKLAKEIKAGCSNPNSTYCGKTNENWTRYQNALKQLP